MAIYRSQKGNEWHLIIGRGGKTNESPFTTTCAALVHEPSDNDGGWVNSRMQRAFWEHINGFLNCPISTYWTSWVTIASWTPWFVLENWAWIKGGLLYGPVIFEHIWASSFNLTIWPVLPLGPSLKSPLSPLNKWSSSIRSTLHLQDPIRWSASLTRKWLLSSIVSRLLGSAGDYNCWANLLKWEPFPKPLSPYPTPT